MASTYSSLLKIELIGSGEQSNSWGDTTNDNFSKSVEFSIAGVYSKKQEMQRLYFQVKGQTLSFNLMQRKRFIFYAMQIQLIQLRVD